MRKYLNLLAKPLGYEIRRRSQSRKPGAPVAERASAQPQAKKEKGKKRPPAHAELLDLVAGGGGEQVDFIFDVGANVGRFAMECRERFPQAKIIAFEPGKTACDRLRERFAGDTRTEIENLALGDAEGEAAFYENAFSPTNSLLPQTATAGQWISSRNIAPVGEVTTPVSTLDRYCALHGIERIDLLKIDTQGFELHVIHGGRNLLERHAVRWLYIEMLLVPIYEGQAQFHEILAQLHKLNYALFSFHGGGVSSNGRLMWTNGIFCRPSDAEPPPLPSGRPGQKA